MPFVHRRRRAWRSSSRRWRTSCSRPSGASEEGQASGANNAIRELGGVFGVAVLASVFARYGGYETRPDVRRRDDARALDRGRRRRPRRGRRVRDPARAPARGASSRRRAARSPTRPEPRHPRRRTAARTCVAPCGPLAASLRRMLHLITTRARAVTLVSAAVARGRGLRAREHGRSRAWRRGSTQFADLSSREPAREPSRSSGGRASRPIPAILALVAGGPAEVERVRARIDRDPAVARTVVDENGVVLAFLHARGGERRRRTRPTGSSAAFADDPQRAPRRRRDRLAPGDRGDPARPPARRADRVPARPPALVLGLPRPRRGVPAAARRRRRDRAHVPRAPGRRRGALRSRSSRSTSSPASASASRSTTRSSSSPAGARRRRGTGTGPRRSRRRCGPRAAPSSSARSPSPPRWRCLLVFPQQFLYSMGLGGVLVALAAGARRARAAAGVPLLARPADRRARAAPPAAGCPPAAAGRGSPPG